MLNKAFEFLRIADPQPSNEKVRVRTKSAADLVAQFAIKANRNTLMAVLQGVVAGFDGPVFIQESPAVVVLIKAIKDQDVAFPEDLKENGLELRAVAGIAVGELLEKTSKGKFGSEAILAALSISSASLRPAAREKHIRWMNETLLTAADKVLVLEAARRRERGTPALNALDDIELPEEGAESNEEWKGVLPAVKSALDEARSVFQQERPRLRQAHQLLRALPQWLAARRH